MERGSGAAGERGSDGETMPCPPPLHSPAPAPRCYGCVCVLNKLRDAIFSFPRHCVVFLFLVSLFCAALALEIIFIYYL